MAQPIKGVPTPTSFANSGTKDVASGPVAAITTPIVEELTPNTSANFDGHPFGYKNRIPANDDKGNQKSSSNRQHFGFFNAPTETFAAIMEISITSNFFSISADNARSVPTPNVAKAVHEYELNLAIVSRTKSTLGTELSILL